MEQSEMILTEPHMAILGKFGGDPTKYIAHHFSHQEWEGMKHNGAWSELLTYYIVHDFPSYGPSYCLTHPRLWHRSVWYSANSPMKGAIVISLEHIAILRTFTQYLKHAQEFGMVATIRDDDVIASDEFQELLAWGCIQQHNPFANHLFIINMFDKWLLN